MPNFNLSQQPQYPIVTKDTDIALTNDQIQSLFCNKDIIVSSTTDSYTTVITPLMLNIC